MYIKIEQKPKHSSLFVLCNYPETNFRPPAVGSLPFFFFFHARAFFPKVQRDDGARDVTVIKTFGIARFREIYIVRADRRN